MSSFSAASDISSAAWDSHGLPANIIVELGELSVSRRYKVSETVVFDLRLETAIGSEDSFYEIFLPLPDGKVYTKSQLQVYEENFACCGLFEGVDMEVKTKPDGTVGIKISFIERIYQSADAFRCIKIDLMTHDKLTEMGIGEIQRSMDGARDCLLPIDVQREIANMLREEGMVSARMLQRIRCRVQNWYHKEGYACAQVVNFGNMNNGEVVCVLVEGNITQVVLQDEHGNVYEGNNAALVWSVLPEQLQIGHVFGEETAKQALNNIMDKLGWRSTVGVCPRPDEEHIGGIIVEIKLGN